MNWKDKMDAIVKDVLGIEYTCVVNSDTSYSIFENNEMITRATTGTYLDSHWRNAITETLEIIFKERIQKSLLKY